MHCWVPALGPIAFDRAIVGATWFLWLRFVATVVAYRFYSALCREIAGAGRQSRDTAEVNDDGRDFVPTTSGCYSSSLRRDCGAWAASLGRLWPHNLDICRDTLADCWSRLCGLRAGFYYFVCSIRRNGKTLGEMAREEVSRRGGFIAQIAVLAIMVILLGVVALVIVNALKSSPWATFTLAMTIPIALILVVPEVFSSRAVIEASFIGVALVLFVVVAGQWVAESPSWRKFSRSANHAGLYPDDLWICCFRIACLVVAGAARLSQRVH